MFADLVILVFLAAIVGAIYLFATSQSSAKSKRNSALDLQHNQFNLKTNARPLSQQELIDKAQVRADASRRYIAQHTDSMTFGKKDAAR